MYIKRHLETTIEKLSGCCKVLLVTGPRQVGKTTLLRRLAEGNRTYVTMDDINVRISRISSACSSWAWSTP